MAEVQGHSGQSAGLTQRGVGGDAKVRACFLTIVVVPSSELQRQPSSEAIILAGQMGEIKANNAYSYPLTVCIALQLLDLLRLQLAVGVNRSVSPQQPKVRAQTHHKTLTSPSKNHLLFFKTPASSFFSPPYSPIPLHLRSPTWLLCPS